LCDGVVAVAGSPVFAIKVFWSERDKPNSQATPYAYVESFEP